MLIAFVTRWGEAGWLDSRRVSASVGLFNAGRCNAFIEGDDGFYHLREPRERPSPSWRPARTLSGLRVLLSGWIDNRVELRQALRACGTEAIGSDDAALYGAAFEAWGHACDARVVGTYATVIALPQAQVRLSRSPWNGMPLFYACDSGGVAVASVPRPIFAAGWPQRLREGAVERLLAFRTDLDTLTPFEGVFRLPAGCVAVIDRAGVRLDRWYDPLALSPTALDSDEAYVERAADLLGEAAAAALQSSQRPALQLSGGLDSAIAADALLRCLPESRRLRTYTFHPPDGVRIACPPTLYPDERPWVEAFVAQHPRIDPVFVDNGDLGFDDRARDLFLAGGTAFPAMVLTTAHHGCLAAAARDGCDWLLNANLGNITISGDAPWAWPELFAQGKWLELWRLLRNRPGDERSMARRVVAHGLMPNLPKAWQDRIRRLVHGSVPDDFGNTLLKANGPAQRFSDDKTSDNIATAGELIRNRSEWLEQTYRYCGSAAELWAAQAQVFGVRTRDVTQYRPLIEFCVTIPTGQLAGHGQRRRLARRLARGRMPEEQRLNQRLGMHNADWHAKMARDLPRLRRKVDALADHPVIGPSIDVSKARALLDSFPVTPPDDPTGGAKWRFNLPAALLIADYVDFVTGRNA